MDCITNIDFTVLNWLHDTLSCRFLDSVMPVITKLGSKGIIWLAVAFVMMCTRKYRKCGILMVISLIAGVLIGNLFLKNIIARPRPCWINEDFPMLMACRGIILSRRGIHCHLLHARRCLPSRTGNSHTGQYQWRCL